MEFGAPTPVPSRLDRLGAEISGTLGGTPTQISIVRIGGNFDNGAQLPLSFGFSGRF